jgi:hypothetical protein
MRIATLSDNGPRLHGGDFEAEGVNGVLLGESPLLVRIGFDRPTDVRATPVPAGSDGDGASGGGEVGLVIGPVRGPVVLQLSFREERNGAADLADAARQAERADRPAECLAHWAELLRRFPFDAALVAEATAERARHVQEGLDRVEEIRAAFERARFFDLEGIYRRERTNVAAVEERYAGSEVAEEAARLRAEIDTALASHVDADREARRERLARVAAILEERGADDLARHVRESAPDASAADRPSEGGD